MKYPKLYIAESIIGFLAFDDENSLVDKSLFSKKPEEAVESFLKVESGEPIQEFDELISRLSKECSLFAFEKFFEIRSFGFDRCHCDFDVISYLLLNFVYRSLYRLK